MDDDVVVVDDEVDVCEVEVLVVDRQFWVELEDWVPPDCRTGGTSGCWLQGAAAAHVLSGSVSRSRGGCLTRTLQIALLRVRCWSSRL